MMNSLDDAAGRHRQAWELIPWVVNGTAAAEQRRIVEEHLAGCEDCRRELAFQSQLRTAMAQDAGSAPDGRAALQRLWSRIDHEDAPLRAGSGAVLGRRAGVNAFTRGLMAAVIVEALGLSVLGAALWQADHDRGSAPLYRTLSAPAAVVPRATVRAVLAPTLTLGELQELLRQARLQIVEGPSQTGVYTLAPSAPPERKGTLLALARLRAHPAVRLAEPIEPAADASR
jgi:anti-sigma factor RsiW